MECCGFIGIFLDLSDHDMLMNESFEMGFLTKSRHYQAIKLSSIFMPEFAKEKKVRVL